MATASRKKLSPELAGIMDVLKAPPRKRVTKKATEAPALKTPAKKAPTKKAVTKRVLTGAEALKVKARKTAATAAAAVVTPAEPPTPVQKLPTPANAVMVGPALANWPGCCSGYVLTGFNPAYGHSREPFATAYAKFKAHMDKVVGIRPGAMLVAAVKWNTQKDAYFLLREYGFREAARCITSSHGSEMIIMVKESDKPLPFEGN